eukprot:1082150-Rhodomonas_salina.2
MVLPEAAARTVGAAIPGTETGYGCDDCTRSCSWYSGTKEAHTSVSSSGLLSPYAPLYCAGVCCYVLCGTAWRRLLCELWY